MFSDGVNNGYSNSKKKKLLTAFEEALKLMSKSEADKYKKKTNENKFDSLELDENKDKSKQSDKSKINVLLDNLNLKSKRSSSLPDSNNSNSLLLKISNYLKYTAKNLNDQIESNEKEMLFKVFSYLKKFRIDNPIENLKTTQLGIVVKFLSHNLKNESLKNMALEMNRIFEDQVLEEMFSKAG